MHTINHSIGIAAPRERVAQVMLALPTYEQWTKVFDPTSSYEGDWSEGSVMKFVSTDPATKQIQGMVARVREHRPAEHVSIEHYAMIVGGVELPHEGSATGFENYTFADTPEGTLLTVEMTNVPDEYVEMFNDQWPRALQRLKTLVESN